MRRRCAFACLVLVACGQDAVPPGDDTPPPPPEGAVYYGQVQKIFNENCVECHDDSADRLAPFSLTSYANAVTAATDFPMAFDVMNRIMPPYFAQQDGDCNTYNNTKWLSQEDLATLVEWINGDKLEGDVANSVAPPPPLPGLAQVDTTVDIGVDYLPNTATIDDYQCFVIDPLTAFDNKFVIGAHVKPTNLSVAHHVILYTLDQQAETDVEAKLAAAGGPSYPCPAGPNDPTVGRADFLIAWAPGQQALNFPAGTGIRIDGTRKLVLQMHYNTAVANGQTDRTKIELDFADAVSLPARMVKMVAPVNLPPGQVDATATVTELIPNNLDGKLWGGIVHMHGRGTKAKLIRDNGGACLMDLVNWNFHWQHFYMYDTPVALGGGDTLRLTCHYDTTLDTQNVTFCENTDCEMCIVFGYATR
jgi:hypothetical protein